MGGGAAAAEVDADVGRTDCCWWLFCAWIERTASDWRSCGGMLYTEKDLFKLAADIFRVDKRRLREYTVEFKIS